MPTLNQASINLLGNINPQLTSQNVINTFQQSSNLVNLLNNFASGQGNTYVAGQQGSATQTSPNASGGFTTTVSPGTLNAFLQNSDNGNAIAQLGDALGHEAGHATEPNGDISLTSAASPQQAAQISNTDEAVATVAEFSVQQDFQAAGYSVSLEGGSGIQSLLTNIKQQDAGTNNFYNDAVSQGANYINGNVYSGFSPNLYNGQAAEDFYVLSYSGALSATQPGKNQQSILANLQPSDIYIDTNSSGSSITGQVASLVGPNQQSGYINFNGTLNAASSESNLSGSSTVQSYTNSGTLIGSNVSQVTNGVPRFTMSGSNFYLSAGGNSAVTSNGSAGEIDGTGATISEGSNAFVNLYGQSNSFNVGSGSVVGAYGGSNTINYGGSASNEFIVLGSTGSLFDTVHASGVLSGGTSDGGQGTGIYVNSNSSVNLVGNGNYTGVSSGGTLGAYGGGNTISGGASEYIVVGSTNNNYDTVNASNVSGSGSTAAGDGYGIAFSSNSQANINGSKDLIISASGSSLGAYGGGNTVYTGAGELTELGSTGSSADTVNAASDGTSGSTANGQGTGIYLLASSQAGLNGSGDHVGFYGSSDQLSSTDTNIGITQNLTTETVTGSNEVLDIGSGVSVTVTGSHDSLYGGKDDTIHYSGTYDTANVSDSTVDYSGSNTGDDVDGSGDSGSDWSGSSGGGSDSGDGGYGYGGYGGYGLSKAPSTQGANIGVIGSYDAAITNQAEAQFAQTARLQAESVIASAGSGLATPEFEGAKWTGSKTITWSLADGPDGIGAQMSGMVGSSYASLIAQAFQTWSTATGLTFEEVDDSASPDIRIGWSTFNSPTSGVLGYTGFRAMNGSILSGATISLENPSDDALVTDQNGKLSYSGTQTEFVQLVMHEIGHALGLAADSDVDSIMYPVLSGSNRTLDATDLLGAQTLYGNGATLAGVGVSTSPASALRPFETSADQMIAAMASFAPGTSTALTGTTLAAVASTFQLAAASTMATAH